MPIYKINKQRGGKQGYRVRVNFTDQHSRYQTKTRVIYGYREAKRTEFEMLQSIEERINSARIPLSRLYEQYIEYKRDQVRETTLCKTVAILNNHVLPILGEVRIDQLDVQILQDWKKDIMAKDLSVPMCKNIYGELFTLLNYAVRMDYLLKNPLEKLGNFKEVYFEKPQDTLHYYTAAQFRQYIETARTHLSESGERGFYVFFNIAFYTGMRKGEINALRWSDIEGDIIHVRRSVTQKLKGRSIVETPPKNRTSYRDIQIPRALKLVLEEQRKYQQTEGIFNEELRVCGGEHCLSDTAISNHNMQYADEAGLPHIRIHDFRHTHATLLVNEGINIQEIARRLGHAKIEITWNTYSHLYPREEERAVKILDGIFTALGHSHL